MNGTSNTNLSTPETATRPTFDQYQATALARGFDEVAERRWNAAVTAPLHTHPFSVEALVVEGEMWLTVGDSTQHLRPGDTFALDLEQPHSERYGEQGATYWAARRNGRNR